MEVNIHHAKTNLSKLIFRVEAGEESLIARNGKPVARLVPVESTARKFYKPGTLKGCLRVPADFLEPGAVADREIEALFNLNPILSNQPTRTGRRNAKRNMQ